MIDLALSVIAAPVALTAAYSGVLGLLSLPQSTRRDGASPAAPRRAFAVVVPAHNEERALPRLLRSISAAAGGRGDVRVHVIADNCTDGSASVARQAGATVWERFDDARRSKGHALSWLMDQPAFWASPFDAVAFIDADCTVHEGFFDALERGLASGADALQARYDVLEPSRSATLELRQFAFGLVHVVRPLGKRAFGGSAGLKGTGMCFTRDALAAVPWRATGLAEDVEQHIRLVRSGRTVRFAPDAIVAGAMPSTLRSAASQHERWEAGRLAAAHRLVPGLLADAIRARSVVMLDAATEQIVPPVAVVGIASVCLLAAGVAFQLPVTLALSGAAVVALACYAVAGVAILRPSLSSLARAAAVAPLYATWKLARFGRALVPGRTSAWTRTSRDEAA